MLNGIPPPRAREIFGLGSGRGALDASFILPVIKGWGLCPVGGWVGVVLLRPK